MSENEMVGLSERDLHFIYGENERPYYHRLLHLDPIHLGYSIYYIVQKTENKTCALFVTHTGRTREEHEFEADVAKFYREGHQLFCLD